jgi:hypothetical protein
VTFMQHNVFGEPFEEFFTYSAMAWFKASDDKQ